MSWSTHTRNFLPSTIKSIFLTLQECMDMIVKCGGGNHYRLPHMRKMKLLKDKHGNIKPIVAAVPILDVEADSASKVSAKEVEIDNDESDSLSMAEEEESNMVSI